MLMGIDPGHTSGIAIVNHGRLIYCKQYARDEALDKVSEIALAHGVKRVVVEMPRKGLLYARHRMQGKKDTTALQASIAQSVGQNLALARTFMTLLRRDGIEADEVQPGTKRKGTPGTSKWNPTLWARVFDLGANRLPGQHARDAAVIAYLNEGKPIPKPKEKPHVARKRKGTGNVRHL